MTALEQLGELVNRVRVLDDDLAHGISDLIFDLVDDPDTRGEVLTDIRTARQLRAMTLRDLAGKVGVSEPTVCRWETGVNSISDRNKVRVAAALDIDVRSLILLNRKEAS